MVVAGGEDLSSNPASADVVRDSSTGDFTREMGEFVLGEAFCNLPLLDFREGVPGEGDLSPGDIS